MNIHGDVATQMVGDTGKLRQVLMNLLGNALKFTEIGEISIKVTRLVKNENIESICFTVTDSGVGIPDDRKDLLFKHFSQIEAAPAPSEGTGLGLAISKRLVAAMGGEIGCVSEPGKGSSFFFTLPLRSE